MTDLIKKVESERHHVVVDVYSAPLSEVMDQYIRGDLTIDPAYQRAFRWTNAQQTRYIESLLLNIPTPPFFFAEGPDGKFEIIDGLQRFSTILKFFAAERNDSAPPASDDAETQNDIDVPILLSEAPLLPALQGTSRTSLPDTLVRTLRYARTQIMLLKKESSSLARFHVFTRLNRAGSPLSNQEIRNCSARLSNPDFANELLKIADMESVKLSMTLPESEEKKMGAAENVLRLIAFSHFEITVQKLEQFLDDVMYKAASGEFKFSREHSLHLIETFNFIAREFPNGEAFKFFKAGAFKGSFSTNLFDIVACGVYKNIEQIKGKPLGWLKNKLVKLNSDKAALALTGAGSNTRAKMMGRVSFGAKWFAA